MSRTTDLAYLAGAIDSDGTIGIKKSTYSMRVVGDSANATYSERVALRQVLPIVPTMLRNHFGGSLYITKPSAARGKPLWSWAATDLRATECLRALLPYLRLKNDQALNCLNLRSVKEQSKKARVLPGRSHMGSAPRSAALTSAMEKLYLKAKALNVVGI